MITRTLDTMSDAIALASPSGRMSRRAREAAENRLGKALFDGWTREDFTGRQQQPTADDIIRRQVKRLRDLAARGMSVRRFTTEANRLEQSITNKE